jgi:tetratricopeptide (TPR) repeat protein
MDQRIDRTMGFLRHHANLWDRLSSRSNRGRKADSSFIIPHSSFLKLAVVALALVALTGCNTLPASAAKQVKQGRVALDAGRYDESETMFSTVIDKHPNNAGTAEAYYCRGLARLQLRRTEDGRRDMETASRLAQDKQLKALAEAQLGNLDFDAGRYADAVRHYRAARPHLPYAQPTDRVWYQYGVALQHTGETSEARQVFDDLPRFYPGSPYARSARTASSGRTADTRVLRSAHGATIYPGSATSPGSGGYTLVAPAGSSGGAPPVASPSSPYSIQCGSFQSQSLAEQAADNLRVRGLNAQAFADPRGGGRYVVRVGSYNSQHEAAADLPRIRRVQKDAFVVGR